MTNWSALPGENAVGTSNAADKEQESALAARVMFGDSLGVSTVEPGDLRAGLQRKENASAAGLGWLPISAHASPVEVARHGLRMPARFGRANPSNELVYVVNCAGRKAIRAAAHRRPSGLKSRCARVNQTGLEFDVAVDSDQTFVPACW